MGDNIRSTMPSKIKEVPLCEARIRQLKVDQCSAFTMGITPIKNIEIIKQQYGAWNEIPSEETQHQVRRFLDVRINDDNRWRSKRVRQSKC